ncbi:MAG TPA: response regulator [Candidatus Limnocylindrales bacterium]|nr:response regulator [Candidatus Limnocylindrales bacterium]
MGLVVLAPAVLMWLRASSPRPGQLIVMLVGAYYLHFMRGSAHPVVFAAGFCLAFLWTAIFGHLVLTWTTGRITDRLQRIMVPAGYLAAVGSQVVRYVVEKPHGPFWTFGVGTEADAVPTLVGQATSVLYAAFSLGIVAIVVRRWAASNPLRRRPGAPIWLGVILASAVSVAMAIAAAVNGWKYAEMSILLAGLIAGVLSIPSVYAVRLLRNTSARWDLATVALGVQDAANRNRSEQGAGQLQKALADAVGDPSLRLVYCLHDGSHVDIHGRATPAPQSSTQRAVSPVRRRGQLLALIEHDQALAHDRSIAEATSAAAGLAIENAHLYATMQAQIEQIRASRLRLATTALEERQRIQRDLHDGAQQVLLAVLVLLDVTGHHLAGNDTDQAGTSVRRAHERLTEAINMLREFTERIYPVTLIEQGLGQAIERHADISPIPLTVNVSPGRWPLPVETTAYFVISESLANTYKHAEATGVTVDRDPAARPAGRGDHRRRPRRRADPARAWLGGTAGPCRGDRGHALHRRATGRDTARRATSAGGPMRVVIVEDQGLLRDALADGLRSRDIAVVGQARDHGEALAAIDQSAPDIVLLDIRLPPTFTDEGLSIAEEVRSRYPDVAVLVLSSFAELAYAERLLSMQQHSHAVGYLLKDRVGDLTELVNALHRIAVGEVLIDSHIIDTLMNRRRRQDPLDTLTPYERRVFDPAGRGPLQPRDRAGSSLPDLHGRKTPEQHHQETGPGHDGYQPQPPGQRPGAGSTGFPAPQPVGHTIHTGG